MITNVTLDPDEESFDVAQLGLKVMDEQQTQPRYPIRRWIEALDNNVETGPGVGQSKEKFTILLISENDLLVAIAKEEESLHVKLEDTVNKLKEARMKLEQVVQELPSLRVEEFSPMALRADEIHRDDRPWFGRQPRSLHRLPKDSQGAASQSRSAQDHREGRAKHREPLDQAVNQEFVHSEESITAFHKTLDKDKKADFEAANLARRQLEQLIGRLDSRPRCHGGHHDHQQADRTARTD